MRLAAVVFQVKKDVIMIYRYLRSIVLQNLTVTRLEMHSSGGEVFANILSMSRRIHRTKIQVHYLMFLIFALMALNAKSQSIYNDSLRVKKSSRFCYQLETNGIIKDTLCIDTSANKLYYYKSKIRSVNHNIITIDFILGDPDYGTSYFFIEKWGIVDDHFVQLHTSVAFISRKCKTLHFSMKIKEDGIKWFYKKNIFSVKKGFLSFEEIEKNKEIYLPCYP